MNGQNRSDVKIGAKVKIVLKADQRTGKLTEGTVEKLLTKSSFHPHDGQGQGFGIGSYKI